MSSSPMLNECQNRIPAPLISLIADNISSIETHAGIDSLFMYADAPGEPPLGSKPAKCLEWLRLINQQSENPLAVVGLIIEGYMEYEATNAESSYMSFGVNVEDKKQKFKEKLIKSLDKYDFVYEQGGNLYKSNSNIKIANTLNNGLKVAAPMTMFSDKTTSFSKVFISHSNKDKLIVSEVISLLEAMGVKSDQIFCTSFDGYGISPGENFLEAIKNELNANTIVLFILSDNFYKSRVCLCEMGAAWVLSKKHVPIVIPPLKYEDIQGVIPLTQGVAINDKFKLNSLKDTLVEAMSLDNVNHNIWEQKRDRVLQNIESFIA